MNLPIHWTAHLHPEDQEGFAQAVRNSKHVLARLDEILNQKEKSEDRFATGVRPFEQPNYGPRIAYSNGYIQALREVRDLIKMEEDNHVRENSKRVRNPERKASGNPADRQPDQRVRHRPEDRRT